MTWWIFIKNEVEIDENLLKTMALGNRQKAMANYTSIYDEINKLETKIEELKFYD
jgi:hypothetical protein